MSPMKPKTTTTTMTNAAPRRRLLGALLLLAGLVPGGDAFVSPLSARAPVAHHQALRFFPGGRWTPATTPHAPGKASFPAVRHRLAAAAVGNPASTTTTAAAASSRSLGAGWTPKDLLATSMAFLTGWADLVIFLQFKCFASMMTGNTLWWMHSLTQGPSAKWCFYPSILLAYWIGLAVAKTKSSSSSSWGWAPLATTGLWASADLLRHGLPSVSGWIPIWLLAAGFAIVNSFGQAHTGNLTFVVTGHMTRVVHFVTDHLSITKRGKPILPSLPGGVSTSLRICLGFAAGALFGSLVRSGRMALSSASSSAGELALLGGLYGAVFRAWNRRSAAPAAEEEVVVVAAPPAATASRNTTTVPA